MFYDTFRYDSVMHENADWYEDSGQTDDDIFVPPVGPVRSDVVDEAPYFV